MGKIKKLKPKQNQYEGWSFYEARIEAASFEWPALNSESYEKAEHDCIMYLNELFQGKYKMTKFRLKEEGPNYDCPTR